MVKSSVTAALALAAGTIAAIPAYAAGTTPAYKPVTLAKLYMDMPTGTPFIDVTTGVFCLGERKITYSGGRIEQKLGPVEDSFRTAMEKAGVKVGGGDDLFQTNTDSADYELGAVVTAERLNVCETNAISHTVKGEISLTVDWQVYSKLRQKIVGRFTTTGSAAVPDAVPGGNNILWSQGFGDSARRLAANPDFLKVLATDQPESGTVITAGDDPRIVLRGAASAPSRPMTEAAGDVVVVLNGESSGSGVLVSQDGYVLTAAHVVGKAHSVTLRWSDSLETVGEVVRVNEERDVALIKTSSRDRTPLAVKRGPVAQGQTVYAIGAPLGVKFQSSVTRGIASASRIIDGKSYIQSDVSVAPGSSGGPLLDEDGRVIGLTVSGATFRGAPVGLNMFIPIGDALDFLSLDPR